MNGNVKKRAGPLAAVGAVLLCLPCLLPVLAVFIGVGAFSAFGGFLADTALAVWLGAGAVLLAVPAGGWALVARRRRGTVCEPHGGELAVLADARTKRAS